jgi:hypothetical protein
MRQVRVLTATCWYITRILLLVVMVMVVMVSVLMMGR